MKHAIASLPVFHGMKAEHPITNNWWGKIQQGRCYRGELSVGEQTALFSFFWLDR